VGRSHLRGISWEDTHILGSCSQAGGVSCSRVSKKRRLVLVDAPQCLLDLLCVSAAVQVVAGSRKGLESAGFAAKRLLIQFPCLRSLRPSFSCVTQVRRPSRRGAHLLRTRSYSPPDHIPSVSEGMAGLQGEVSYCGGCLEAG